MTNRWFVLQVVGVLAGIALLIFLIAGLLYGNKNFMIPVILLGAYIVYIFQSMLEEYTAYKKDKEDGLVEAKMKLYDIKIFSKNVRDGIPALPLVTFKGKGDDEYITLGGDFSKINLEIGKMYRVVYYKNSKIMVIIEKL